MDRSGPAAVGTARILIFLKIDTKRVIELRDGAGEHDRTPALVLLDNSKTVLMREFPNGLNVGRRSPELLGVFVMGQVALRFVASCDFPYPFLQRILLAMAQDHGDFQPFRRIGLSQSPCARQRRSLATDERICWHSSTLLNFVYMCRAASASGSATARSGSRTEIEFLWCWLLGRDRQTT